MPDVWPDLARRHGRRAVMSLQVTDAEMDEETRRQIPILFGIIEHHLTGAEKTALDFGCGAGRFSHALAQTIKGRVTAVDPCHELIAMAPGAVDVDYHPVEPGVFFDECVRNGVTYDVVFAAMVLGAPDLPLEATAADLVSVLAPGGLLVVVDHMPEIIPYDRWWRFRPVDLYQEMFQRNGIEVRKAGALMQLDNEITVLCGRKL